MPVLVLPLLTWSQYGLVDRILLYGAGGCMFEPCTGCFLIIEERSDREILNIRYNVKVFDVIWLLNKHLPWMCGLLGSGIRVTCMRYMGSSTPLTSHEEMKGKKLVRETIFFKVSKTLKKSNNTLIFHEFLKVKKARFLSIETKKD